MKNAIMVPGRPNKEDYYNPELPTNSNAHWFPWAQKQLQIRDIFAVAIEPPRPYSPRYEAWRREFERFDISSDTVLIGHSCGGGFLVRWLSENTDRRVGRVVLVAPWLDPERDHISDTADFFDFETDPELVGRTAGVTIFNSDSDTADIHESVQMIRETVPGIRYREFHNYGHFCLGGDPRFDMPKPNFDELIEAAVS